LTGPIDIAWNSIFALVDELMARTGLDIPIHVDGASGAFIAPFAHPNLKWSFDVPRVVSINTSGHKFGLVYAGLGWVLWRDESYLHRDLIFELREYHFPHPFSLDLFDTKYFVYQTILGVLNTPSPCKCCLFASNTVSNARSGRNFSKPAAPIIAQMFNFLNLGFEGYKKIAYKDLRNARMLSRALESTYFKVQDPNFYLLDSVILIRFQVLSNIHRPAGGVLPHQGTHSRHGNGHDDDPEHFNAGLPVVAFWSVLNLLSEYWRTHS
jgi:glutamate decarboxylase